jgi:carboxylesterase
VPDANGTEAIGVLVLHGFTGSPGTMQPLTDGLRAAGFDVTVPTLPGHATVVDDMVPTRWDDWSSAAEAAYLEVAARFERVVVAGLSMGGTLTCWLASRHPEIAGIVCVNPLVLPRDPAEIAFIDELIAAGEVLTDAVGDDIAMPGVIEPCYDKTPLAALRSLLGAVHDLQDGLGRITMPLLLLTSVEDHVVDPLNSDHLANSVSGPAERVRLERSYHVAVLDYDQDLIVDRSVEFITKLG